MSELRIFQNARCNDKNYDTNCMPGAQRVYCSVDAISYIARSKAPRERERLTREIRIIFQKTKQTTHFFQNGVVFLLFIVFILMYN